MSSFFATTESMETIHLKDDAVIYCWFSDGLHEDTLQRKERRALEREEVLSQLKTIFGEKTTVLHTDFGQPIIRNTPYSHISISHSDGWYAVFLAMKPIGIDIQCFRENILKGKHYFVNTEEEKLPQTIENFHLIWGGKEAVYKKYSGHFNDLKNDVTVVQLDDSIMLQLFENQIECCCYKVTKEWALVWTNDLIEGRNFKKGFLFL